MITVLKLTFANIRQKKFRSVLIVLSIVLSAALMYAVLSISTQTTRIFEQKIRKEAGNAQLMIIPAENSGEQYIPELDFDSVEGMEYHIPLVAAYGYSKLKDEMTPVLFTGMSSEDYDTNYGLEFLDTTAPNLSENQVFIGREAADVYQLASGDELEVTIGGAVCKFTVAGIVEDRNNNLSYDPGILELVASRETLADILGLEEKVSGYYIRSDARTAPADLQSELEKVFPKLQVKDVMDSSDYKQMLEMIVTSLLLMVLAVVMVSAFIIHSSFKIIAIERMPLMGTLRSIGATRKMTVRTLLFEAVFYGILGGIIGNALGVLVLAGTMEMMFSNFGMRMENVSYINPGYLLAAFFIGLALASFGAMAPIIRTSKRSIRSIIFGEIQNEKHTTAVKTVLGIALMAAAFLLFQFAPANYAMPFNLAGILSVTVGGNLVIPMVSRLLTRLLTLLLAPFYKDKIGIVTANLNNDRTMMNNILLLAMGLGVILMINNFSTTAGKAVTDVYATGKSDAVVNYELEDSFIEQVRETEGVEHVYANSQVNDLTANQGEINLMYVDGIDGKDFSKYAWDEFGKYLTDDLMDKFTSKRSVILSRFTARKYDLGTGDILNIDFSGKSIPYEVIAIVPSIMNNGNVTYVYEGFLEEDSGVKTKQWMYINIRDSYDTREVIQRIKELMPYGILPIQTLQEMQEQNAKSNNGMFFLMKAVSVIAMFIGVVGILNNFTISFLSRKKLMATMRSLGLSKKSTIHNMLLEAFFCGALGTICGLLLGTVLVKAMCYVIDAMGIPSEVIYYSLKDYGFVLVSGIALSLISAVLPAISIAKENIVAGLRYE
jgi:putative ABC transport system permease protein